MFSKHDPCYFDALLQHFIREVNDGKMNLGNLFAVRKEKAQFLKCPEDVEVTEEEDVRFEATVTARPQPIVEW